VRAHEHELPTTLAELSRYPIPFRKAIVDVVGPERRGAFWREHLATFLTPDAGLTPPQRALVEDAIVELPAIFAVPRADGETRARALEDRMRTTITREQAHRIFGTLGPLEPPGGLSIPPDALPPSGA
jgi:hypothetical protein